jgi:DNA-binding FadR family transcriptional regulator
LVAERRLVPGDRLPSEGELAQALGVNRLTVREGLRSLESLGLVEARAGSGWYLRRFSLATAAETLGHVLAFHPSAILDLLELRRATEAEVVTRLAGRMPAAELDALAELVERMRWQASRGRHFAAEDAEFHRRIFAASGNLLALALVDVYFAIMERLYREGFPPPPPDRAMEVAEAHGRVVAALRAGDGAHAEETLRASYRPDVGQRLQQWIAGHGPTDPSGAGDLAGGQAAGGTAAQQAIRAALLWRE